MLSRVINFGGVIPAASRRDESFAFVDRNWMARAIRINFLPGQGGTLFIRPQAQEKMGALNDILQPHPEITGDDWTLNLQDIPFLFVRGTALVFAIRNTSARQSRRYSIQVMLEEVQA